MDSAKDLLGVAEEGVVGESGSAGAGGGAQDGVEFGVEAGFGFGGFGRGGTRSR